jgi:hypothetical protein
MKKHGSGEVKEPQAITHQKEWKGESAVSEKLHDVFFIFESGT